MNITMADRFRYAPYMIGLVVLVCLINPALAQVNAGIKKEIILSAIKGAASRNDTVMLPPTAGKNAIRNVLLADTTGYFHIVSFKAPGVHKGMVVISFNPANSFVGITRAGLLLQNGAKQLLHQIALTGLSTKALEGENEPPLSRVFDALGYKVNIGWKSLSNTLLPTPQGDEVGNGLFKKATAGMVIMQPLARYSPDFKLPFGYYQIKNNGPAKHAVAALAKVALYPEHQTLFPRADSGKISFDPGQHAFGLFTQGPDHAIYTQDVWNAVYHPNNALHGVRIYAAKDKRGILIKNAYLLCFEEASNGDYNDYVFLIKNVELVKEDTFATLFNGKNLDGWDTFLQGKGKNTDPDHNFKIEDNALHVNGKDVGYVITKNVYTNYHLKVDFKWGNLRWPPRENTKRDAGICFHVGVNEPDIIWMKCIEFQVQEGDVGDFWMIGKTTIKRDSITNAPADYTLIAKKRDAEKPSGQWNTIELISYNGRCIYIVNGQVVNYGINASITSGRILLQSEYSELYYKNVKISAL